MWDETTYELTLRGVLLRLQLRFAASSVFGSCGFSPFFEDWELLVYSCSPAFLL